VHGGRRRVDPPRGHQGQRGQRPKNHRGQAKPLQKGPEETLPRRGFEGGSVWRSRHLSE
jgi:hypothetical protein